MNKDTTRIEQNSYTCCQFGHEEEEVVGYCLFESCSSTPAFCLKCLSTENGKNHDGHKDYCKGFKTIISLLENRMGSQNVDEEDIRVLIQKFESFENQIEKIFSYKSQCLMNKLSKIYFKVSQIHSRIVEQKTLMENLLISLQTQNYDIFRNQIKEIRYVFCRQLQKNMFKEILKLSENEKFILLKNERYQYVQSQIDRASILYLEKGLGLYKKDRLEQTINYFDIAHNIQSQCVNDQSSSMEQEIQEDIEGQTDAIACYDEAIRLDPQNWNAYYNKGLSLSDAGKYEEAIACYNEAIQLNSEDSAAYGGKGIALHELEKFEDAIACFDEAIRLDSQNSSAYCNKGRALEQLNRHEDAIVYYDEAIRLDLDDPIAQYGKGNALKELRQFEDAILCYDEAIRLDPQYQQAYYNKGDTLDELKRYEEAIVCFDQAIQLDPEDSTTYYGKGHTLHQLEKFEDAIICFDEVIRLDPQNSSAYCKKGDALEELQRHEDAILCYDEAMTLDPEDSNAHCGKGIALYELEKFEDAVLCLNEAIRLDPKNSTAFCNKGLALDEIKKKDKANSKIRKQNK